MILFTIMNSSVLTIVIRNFYYRSALVTVPCKIKLASHFIDKFDCGFEFVKLMQQEQFLVCTSIEGQAAIDTISSGILIA